MDYQVITHDMYGDMVHRDVKVDNCGQHVEREIGCRVIWILFQSISISGLVIEYQ